MLAAGVLLIGGCVLARFSAYWVRQDDVSKIGFVATYYPEDWEKYKQYKAEQKRQAEESRLAVKQKRFKQEKQLWRHPVPNDNWKIVLTCAIVSALIITIVLYFILK